MAVLRREFYNVTRADVFDVIPLGDIHNGNAACDEDLLRHVVQRIEHQPNCYWIGLGDMAEYINVQDKRFEPADLASWVQMADLADLAKAQTDRVCEFLKPIAGKCLGLVEGNHERTIRAHYERDVYLELVTFIKEAGGFPAEHKLAIEMEGWLDLRFYRCKPDERKQRMTRVKISLHHGWVGGRLAGAKALNMQRWLWSHDCDVAVFGHSHTASGHSEAVEYLDSRGNVRLQKRKGVYCGTFLVRPGYARRKGYFPLPYGGCEIRIRPGNEDSRFDDVVQVVV